MSKDDGTMSDMMMFNSNGTNFNGNGFNPMMFMFMKDGGASFDKMFDGAFDFDKEEKDTEE